MNESQSSPFQRRSHLESATKTDEILVQEAQRHPQAFAELYRRYLKSVYSYQMTRMGNVHSDTGDVTARGNASFVYSAAQI